MGAFHPAGDAAATRYSMLVTTATGGALGGLLAGLALARRFPVLALASADRSLQAARTGSSSDPTQRKTDINLSKSAEQVPCPSILQSLDAESAATGSKATCSTRHKQVATVDGGNSADQGSSNSLDRSRAASSSHRAMRDPETIGKAPRREVVCADAMEWLSRPGAIPAGALLFTSLPDMSEVQEFAPSFEEWEAFFMEATKRVLLALPEGGVAVFYQTDVRLPGIGQVSKSYLVLHAASQVSGVRLKWHKIVHFGSVDKPTFSSIQYTHLLCFSRSRPSVQRVGAASQGGKAEADQVSDLGSTIPDVLDRGAKPPGLRKGACCMGTNATAAVIKWAVRRLPGLNTVVDPFCGAGTVLAVANEFGLHAVGVDISPKRFKQAKQLDGAALLAGKAAKGASACRSQSPDS
eukprot:TRINITY_DN61156_c0_g1_i1.p1 TRINITY_DN61156_c0_g1~~TRINITY_DN61156_c0_g1_i1.p1  ORF type:complete len:435 (+),score=67.34 TRINITY_DN61156_c0_g1_i1:79-1305(+)